VENLKKTLRRMEKKVSMEHQNPTLWVVVKRKGTKLGSKSFGRKTNNIHIIYWYLYLFIIY